VNVLFVVFQMVLGIALPLALQLLDRKRFSSEERVWVWNFASWGSALYAFGPLSLLAWGYVTRSPRYWKGLAIGVALTEVALLVQGGLSLLANVALGLPARGRADLVQGLGVTMAAVVVLALLIGSGRAVYELVRPRR
jgi:hypothetical protein